MIDWQRAGIGRIARASGTRRLSTYRGIVAMLDDLYERPAWDVLKAIRTGTLHPLEAFDGYRKHRLSESPEMMARLRTAIDRWLTGYTGRRRADYRTRLNRLIRHGSPDATLASLPDLVRRDKAASGAQPAGFNRSKAAAQAFAREVLGRSHAVYRAISDVAGLRERPAQRPKLSVAEALAIRAKLPEGMGAMWWHLCITGMIVSEYQGPWHVRTDGVEIGGQKAAGRQRTVPLVEPMKRIQVARRRFSEALTALGVISYDARHAFAHWLEEAKIPRARRHIYRGHGPKDIGDVYEMGELSSYRQADGKSLRAYIKRGKSQYEVHARGSMARRGKAS